MIETWSIQGMNDLLIIKKHISVFEIKLTINIRSILLLFSINIILSKYVYRYYTLLIQFDNAF